MTVTLTYLSDVDAYWAMFLGCGVQDLQSPGRTTVYRDNQDGKQDIFVLERNHAQIMSVHACLGSLVEGHSLTLANLMQRWEAVGCSWYGPAHVYYCDAAAFRPVGCPDCVPMGCVRVTGKELREMRDLVPDVEWPQECLDGEVAYGIYCDDALASIATVRHYGDRIAAVWVVTNPAYRRRGYGLATASRVTEHLLGEGRYIPQYDTHVKNASSNKIARHLGFRFYATMSYARLCP